MCLRGRAIDFVGEQKLREYGTGSEAELSLLHVEYRRTGDIGRHQIGGELNAADLATQYRANVAHKQRLTQTRHTLNQDVAAGKARPTTVPSTSSSCPT